MNKYIKNFLFLTICIVGTSFYHNTLASNIQVKSTKIVEKDVANDFQMVRFDLTWDFSWRTNYLGENWDAAWVFIKYRKKTNSIWNHATLNRTGNSGPDSCQIDTNNDEGGNAHGAFIYYNKLKKPGAASFTGIKLRWNYGVDGLDDGDSVEVCVFAIEMVYVPEASFHLGSGDDSESNQFHLMGNTTATYEVTSEGEIPVGISGGLYYPLNTSHAGDRSGPIPGDFPKGFQAFYCMKYEISQQQYTDFLNKLTTTQDVIFFPGTGLLNNKRFGITGTAGNRTTANPYVACNFMKWEFLSGYLDWAALRPMTELEFEKACRGNVAPIPGEYIWGTTRICSLTADIENEGTANEKIISTTYCTDAGNVNRNGQEPFRCGITGYQPGTQITRELAGATYYGIMDMAGNLTERIITVGNAQGRSYTGLHGNGELGTTSHKSDVTNWPDENAVGTGYRGGYFSTGGSVYNLHTSDRQFAAQTQATLTNTQGGRGVRTAPTP